MKTVQDIRDRFLKFFEERGHVIVPASSLIPDDPSVLLTTAGMQQFKPYYTGDLDATKDIHASLGRPLGSNAVVSVQPCVRTPDIEEVGDESHLTMFEMLGNFAFQGEYFKREAINYAWRFITEDMQIPEDRLAVTIFAGDGDVPRDEESERIWLEQGVPKDRIFACDRADNFWGPTGKEGPCGPTVEIHYDLDPEAEGIPNDDSGRYLEIWNIVFNEYYQNVDKELTLLTAKGVDTGMGLERLALVLFDVQDVFGTPLFSESILWMLKQLPSASDEMSDELEHGHADKALLAASKVGENHLVRSVRIIADHMRAAVMLISAGVIPSNSERGYILRRLIRRAKLHAYLLSLPDGWIPELVTRAVSVYADAYKDTLRPAEEIIEAVTAEVRKFDKSLEHGLKQFKALAASHKDADDNLTGEELFKLFETYGFPIELSGELAEREGATIDIEDFKRVQEEHRKTSRAGSERKFGGHGLILDTGELKAGTEDEVKIVTRAHTATHMLQAALREILGDEVQQAGSDITPERLRFDFTFPRKVHTDELQRVENLVNEKVREDLPVEVEQMPYVEAISKGALAFARGAYPETVSVYSIPGFSKEVCGGPHVTRTGEVGKFKILKEKASAAGVRRIRATVE